MLPKNFLKPELSINNIGKWKFWIGIILGIAASIVFSYLFNYSRESLRAVSFMGGDPIILPEKEFRLYDLFFAAISASFGFGLTIIFWLSGRNPKIKKHRLQIYAVANAWFVIFATLLILTRFGYLLAFILYPMKGYDNQLDFIHDFRLLLILIPIYLFTVQWNAIRRIFKTGKWFLISVVFYCITVLFLFKVTPVDREILNKSYYLANKEYFNYIDQEFKKAEKYGISFPDSLKLILQKKYSGSTSKLVQDLQNAFDTDKTVTLDTLILEKIVIHNLKSANNHSYYPFGNPDDNWPYALPEQIYCQIHKHDASSIETRVLFEILKEEASLFTFPDLNWDNYDKYTQYQKDKANFKFNLMYHTETIQSRLIQVIDKLRSEKQYKKYYDLLPEMEFNDEGRQKQIDINLQSCGS